MIDILISGFYGFSNSGDEAVLQSIVELLKKNKPDIRIGVLTKDGKSSDTKGIQVINRTNLLQIVKIMKHCKLFISGGGSLIQDVTSSRSLYYYLGLILLAKIMGTKVMLYSNGIGPVSGKWNRRISGWILNKTDLITLREPDSLEELNRMGVNRPTKLVTADPAIEILPAEEGEIAALKQRIGLDPAKKTVSVSVRRWKNATEKIISVLAQTADRLIEEENVQILLLPLHYSEDYKICKQLQQAMKHSSVLPRQECRVAEMLGLVKDAEVAVGMRLHSLIYAASLNVPVVGIVYDTKVKGFLDYIGQPLMETVEEISLERFYEKIKNALENRDIIQEQLNQRMKELRTLTKQDARMAIDFLEQEASS